MDTHFQPEGLSFDNKNTFNHNTHDDGFMGRFSRQSSQQQNQYPLQPVQQQRQYSPPPAPRSNQHGLPSDPRRATRHQQHQSSLSQSSRSRLSNPQEGRFSSLPGQQINDYSRLSTPPQQQQQQSIQNSPSPNPQQDDHPLLSGEASRSNIWLQTPVGAYPSNDGGYFPGPVDANGSSLDPNGRQSEPGNPFQNPVSQPPSSINTPRESIDLEKQKHSEAHMQWDKHTKKPGRKDPDQPHLPFAQRIKHFTWANYTLTMATGGIATLISIQPHAFPGLITIGAIFYILNLIFFTAITTTMIIRFTRFTGTFKASITHERESLFLGPFFLSIATIITSSQKYVIDTYEMDHPNRTWAVTIMAVAFWAYTFVTFCLATFQYSFLFCCHSYKLTSFMPSWLLPIFPVMLAGTIASVVAESQPVTTRMPIIVAGLGCQGLGFTVAILMYAHYVGRLMQVGYPDREHRGAMFISVGPPSFTCLALIGMANALPDNFDLQGDGLLDGKLLRTMALVVALFLWVLAMWFFMITLVAVLNSWAVYFHLGWWAMVFPNTGFVIATISIGKALNDETILYVGNGLSVAIVAMWCFVLFNHIRAIFVADIIYPGLDEDVADH